MIAPQVYQRYLEALLRGDRSACRAVVQELMAARVPVRTLYAELFRDSLYEVGCRWERGEASVATEHLATAITEDLLSLVFPQVLSRSPIGRGAVVSCAADEFHQVGGRIVADVLEERGWSVSFVGANVPVEALVSLCGERRPHLLCLSVTIESHLEKGQLTVEAVRAAGHGMPIVIGGRAIPALPSGWAAARPGVHLASSLEELEGLLPTWEPPPSGALREGAA